MPFYTSFIGITDFLRVRILVIEEKQISVLAREYQHIPVLVIDQQISFLVIVQQISSSFRRITNFCTS